MSEQGVRDSAQGLTTVRTWNLATAVTPALATLPPPPRPRPSFMCTELPLWGRHCVSAGHQPRATPALLGLAVSGRDSLWTEGKCMHTHVVNKGRAGQA